MLKKDVKLPHGPQKPSFENDNSKSPAMNPGLEDKLKDVREDMLSDKMFNDQLTTLESPSCVKPKAPMRVLISDSQIGLRTPHDSLASSMIKKILQRKWQHIVNSLFTL